jgi:drug/metabolite transporter (DMT)-like permease
VVFGACLVYQAVKGQRVMPPWKELLSLVVIGLVTQVGGVLFLWAMTVVGVAVTATLQMGVMLAAAAVLGLIVLGERIFWQQVAAIVLITLSVIFFSWGASDSNQVSADGAATTAGVSNSETASTAASNVASVKVALGIATSILAGVAFAVLMVGVRKTVTGQTSPEAIMFLINAMGVIACGPWSAYLLGAGAIAEIGLYGLVVMLAAGVGNLAGFLLVTLSLRLITVVRVNVINNGLTTALSAAAGIIIFHEPWNGYVKIAMLLSIAGVLLISLVAPPEEQQTAAATS